MVRIAIVSNGGVRCRSGGLTATPKPILRFNVLSRGKAALIFRKR
jgi:hypothetical protein